MAEAQTAAADYAELPESGVARYHREVAAEIGVPEYACWWESGRPSSAYIAIDQTHPAYRDRDFALLWDEENGWSAAVESRSGEDMIILGYLGDEVLPSGRAVRRFLNDLLGARAAGLPDPPRLRRCGDRDEVFRSLGGEPT